MNSQKMLCRSGLAILVLLAPLLARPQAVSFPDSIRVVELQEVLVTGKQKNQQQHLFHFFNANKAATTEDILSRLPELSLVRRGAYGMDPVIRSFNAAQINVLLDGMRIHGACTDRMDPATTYIEPLNLQNIQVQTGAASLLNGASVGGNINMKLAEAGFDGDSRLSGTVSSGYQSAANALYESLSLDYSTGNWGIKATGTYRKSNEYRAGGGQKVAYSQFEKFNYSLSGKYRLNDQWHLKASLLADDGRNIGYPALPMDVGYASARIGSVGLVMENNLKRWNFFEARLYANKVKHFMDDSHRPNIPMHMDMPGSSFTTGMYAEGRRRIAANRQLSLRMDVSFTDLWASMTMYQSGQTPMFMLTWPNNRQVQSGFAAQYNWKLDSITQIQFNARADNSLFRLTSSMGRDQLKVFGYEQHQRNFFIPSLSVLLSRKLYKKLNGSLSIVSNGRAPSASELYGFYLFNQFDGYDYVGNPGLKAERSLLSEASVTWQSSLLKIRLTGFYSRISHYILGEQDPDFSTMTIGAKGVKVYRNISYANLAGTEASLSYEPLLKTRLIATVKYTRGTDNQGNPLPLIAPLRAVGSARQVLGSFSLQGEWEVAADQNRINSAAGEKTTRAFSLLHARGSYQTTWLGKTWRVDAGVENILDIKYREHLDWGNIPRPGRNIYARLAFGF